MNCIIRTNCNYHFNERCNYALASFMLHQAIELTYRYLELLLVAKDRITHSIRCHHLYLKEISSIYSEVFNEDDQDDIVLLQVLEEIYRSTRYEHNFEIAPEILKRLEVKMEAMQINAERIFTQVLQSFEQYYTANNRITHNGWDIHQEKSVSSPGDNSSLKDIVE